MTNRTSPNLTIGTATVSDADQIVTAVTSQPSDDAGRRAIVTGIVRQWSPTRRRDAVMAIVTNPNHAAIAAILGADIMAAPTGVDPLEIQRDAFDVILSNLATLAVSVDSSLHLTSETANGSTASPDLVDMIHSAIGRAVPITGDALESTTRRIARTAAGSVDSGSRKVRTTVARDWSTATAVYNVAACATTGSAATSIAVDLVNGSPEFTCTDGTTFTSATAALRHAQNWASARGGWGNPFEVLTHAGTGRTLNQITAVTA